VDITSLDLCKIFKESNAPLMAFFRMELNTINISEIHCASELPP
jgi:hypothetical protein